MHLFNNDKKKLENTIIFVMCFITGYIFYKYNIGCIWKKIFGIICPGCGYTRALLCILKLDFKKAFYYHPLFWTIPFLIYCFIGNSNKVKNIILIMIVLLFIVVWIYRLYKKVNL